MFKQDLALNNLQCLTCHKTKPNHIFTYCFSISDEDDIDKKRRKVLPKIPDSEQLFKNLSNPAYSEFTSCLEFDDSLFSFSNGGK